MKLQSLMINQGTIPFLSIKLLKQISHVLQQKKSKSGGRIYKEDKLTSVQVHGNDFKVHHTPADDLESLFYVLIWILVLYDGPLGREQQNFDFESSILGKWSKSAIPNLWVARNSKLAFIVDQNPEIMKSCVSPYFTDLTPLAEKWREIFRDQYGSRDAVDADSLLEVTETFLNNMPSEEPPEMTNVRLTMQEEKNALREASHKLSTPAVKHDNVQRDPRKKRIRDDAIRSMGDLPLSNLSKHQKQTL